MPETEVLGGEADAVLLPPAPHCKRDLRAPSMENRATRDPWGTKRQGQPYLSQSHRQDKRQEVGRATGKEFGTDPGVERRDRDAEDWGTGRMWGEAERDQGGSAGKLGWRGQGWACAGLRHLGRATWATLTWAALTWAGLTGLRGGRGQSRAWLPRTVFVPRRSAFPWAGGAPCRPRRVARQSAQPRPRKARLGPARPPALQEKLRPRDRTAGPVQRQDRGRAPGWLCGRGCLPEAGRSPEGAERGRRPAHGLRAGLAWPRGRRAAPP